MKLLRFSLVLLFLVGHISICGQPVAVKLKAIGSLSFSIYLDGKYLTTEIIHWMGDRFVDKSYPIPVDLTKGKEVVRIRFQAKEDGMVPPVTEVRIMRE